LAAEAGTRERAAMDEREPSVSSFLGRQVHIATESFGKVDPLDLDEYVAHGGFSALARCLGVPAPAGDGGTGAPAPLEAPQLIETIEKSGLRGRGGAGFPTAAKWRLARQQPGDVKYVICNGDEGDPGAFMDRMLLESFPYRILEGLAIAAVAIGAHEGIFLHPSRVPAGGQTSPRCH
jgi:NADH-quinone oxidoreductase subunit F